MRLHLPVKLFRALLACMAAVSFVTFTSASSACYAVTEEEVENELLMLLAEQEYPNGSKTYTTCQTSALTLMGYESILFKDISSTSDGGAIYNYGSRTFTLSGNGSVTFSGNTASSSSSFGGAIYNSGSNASFTLSDNGDVTFSGNTASSSSGGAIYNSGTFTLSDNGDVTFSGNTASSSSSSYSSYGGAIYNSGTFTLSGNGAVTFSGNTASSSSLLSKVYGGAIYNSGTFTLSGNGAVTFSGNTDSSSSYYGGAIYNSGTFTLSGNGNVLFEKNAEIHYGFYRLRSIYSTGTLNLSASEGKRILFKDSVYASGKVNLNNEGTGDIIFTGAYVENDLLELKGEAATSAEIQRSLTSQFHSFVTLDGGSLQVQEGAKLTFDGLAVGASSQSASLQLQNGWVDVSAPLTLASGSSLTFSGCNYLLSSGIIAGENNTLSLTIGEENWQHAALSVIGAIQGESVVIDLGDVSTLTGKNYHLLHVIGNAEGWETAEVRLTGAAADALTWVNGDLYYRYDGSLLPPQAREDRTIKERLTIGGFELLSEYKSLAFEGASSGIRNEDYAVILDNESVTFSENTAGTYGGAIYNKGTFTLSGNGYVTFSGNRVIYLSSFGGAIRNSGTFTLSGNGAVTFSGNTAASSYDNAWVSAGAIVNDGGTFTLSGNGNVSFRENTASSSSSSSSSKVYGGAIDNYATFTLSDNGDVTFSGNTASSSSSSSEVYGGAIYNEGTFTLSGNGDVLFERNAEILNRTYRLRSIYSTDTLNLSASAGKSILFRDSVYAEGTVNLNPDGTGDIIFTGATTETDLRDVKGGADGTSYEIANSRTSEIATNASLYGGRLIVEDGAILKGQGITAAVDSGATIRLNHGTLNHSGYALTFNAGTTFEAEGANNVTASSVNMCSGSTLSFVVGEENLTAAAMTLAGTLQTGSINLSIVGSYDLEAGHAYALLTARNYDTSAWTAENITLTTSDLSFDALKWRSGTLYLTVNPYPLGHITFTSQLTAYRTLGGYESILFKDISSSSYGSAIYNSGSNATFTLSDNGDVTFSGNKASSSYARGGAISNDNYATFTLSGNETVIFSGNTVSSSAESSNVYGGAIDNSGSYASFTLSDNGDVTFIGNKASSSSSSKVYGGAIYNSGSFTLSENEAVTFSGNTASSSSSSDYACGGAIYNVGTFTLSGNGDVLFEKNAEISKGNYRLRSIYSTGTLNLSASAGKSILFRDSVYAKGTVNLNQDGTGDIIFTGATTETDLRDVKGGADGTSDEIANSRTSEIATNASLYGGRLIVEDGAILKGQGITAAVDSGATIRLNHGTLNHSGYALTFNAGTTFEAEGANTVTASSVNMCSGSTLSFVVGEENLTAAAMTLAGTLQTGSINLSIVGSYDLESGHAYALLTASNYDTSAWTAENITLTTSDLSFDALKWRSGTLYLTVNPYPLGHFTFTSRLTGSQTLDGYESILFKDISSSSDGGAIYNRGTFTLSDNGDVTFSGNTASYYKVYGGAIYNSGTFTLSGNGAVTFSGNTASSSSSSSKVYGGAIDNDGTFMLSDNVAVTFSGNTATTTSSSSYAYGGAIYNTGTFTLSGNGNVLFEKNAEVSNGTYLLRSVYSTGTLNLSASEGKNILFRDAVYASSTVNLNQDGTGDIIITGATTEADLREVKGGRAGTADEIANSLSSVLDATVTLGSGTLQVRDGACLTVKEFMASAGAELVLQDAAFTTTGNSTLVGISVSGNSSLVAQEDAVLTLKQAITNSGVLTLTGIINADALSVEQVDSGIICYSNTAGVQGSSGFLFTGPFNQLTLMTGEGTVNAADAVVMHNGERLNIDSKGIALKKRPINYDTYYLNGNDSASLSSILALSPTASVQMSGGTLIVDTMPMQVITAEEDANITLRMGISATVELTGASTLNVTGTENTNTLDFGGGTMNRTLSIVGATVTSSHGGNAGGGDGKGFNTGTTFIGAGGTLELTGGSDALGYASGAAGAITLQGEEDNLATLALAGRATLSTNLVMLGNSLITAINPDDHSTPMLDPFGGTLTVTGTNNTITSGIRQRSIWNVTVEEGSSLLFSGSELSVDVLYGSGIEKKGAGTMTFRNASGTLRSFTADLGETVLDNSTFTVPNHIDLSHADTARGTLRMINGSALNLDNGAKLWMNGYTSIELDASSAINITCNDYTLSIKGAAGVEPALIAGTRDAYYSLDDACAFSNVELTMTSAADKTISSKLVSSVVMNAGSGKLTLSHAENTALTAVNAQGGNITLNAATNIGSLTIAAGKTVVASAADALSISCALTAGAGATLSSALSIADSVSLDLATGNGALSLGNNAITLGTGLSISDAMMSAITSLRSGEGLTLLKDVSSLSGGDVVAADVFAGLSRKYVLMIQDGNLVISIPKPVLTTATWTNASGDREWNVTSTNWAQQNESYTYKDGVDIIFGSENAGEVILTDKFEPKSVLVENGGGYDYTFSGEGGLSGAMALTKQNEGKLTIKIANDYSGGTFLNGGLLVAENAAALGTGIVVVNGGTLEIAANGITNDMLFTGSSSLLVDSGYQLTLDEMLANSGTLTIGGTLDVSALSLSSSAETHIDVNGNGGESGFVKSAAYAVLVVNGGTSVNAGATVKHGELTLSMNSDGTATAGGAIDYSTYYINGESTSLSAILAKSPSATVQMAGGILTIDTNRITEILHDAASSLRFTVRLTDSQTFDEYGELVFNNGNGYSYGSAIYNKSGTFTLSRNGKISFSGNTATDDGGAIYNSSGTFVLNGNGDVSFRDNSSSDDGGAIFNSNQSSFRVSNNNTVAFYENKSGYWGGAICNNATFLLSDNGDISFGGNSSRREGGALYNTGTFTMQGNGNVTFEKNAEYNGSAYRLRSIYSTGTLNIAASVGKSILVKDSVYASGTVNLNQDATGDIIFTGATTEADLREVKGGVDGTAQEILNSRSSVLAASVTLGGGTLQVRDAASLTVKNLTAANGSELVLQDASFATTGNSTLAALTSSGNSSISAQGGAVLTLTQTIKNNGVLTLSGTIVADALNAEQTGPVVSGYFSTDCTISTSGFYAGYVADVQVALAEGTGSIAATDAQVIYHGLLLNVGSNGVATGVLVDNIDYNTYYINGDSASLSAILAKSPSATVQMAGGTLTMDRDVSTEIVHDNAASLAFTARLSSGRDFSSFASVSFSGISSVFEGGAIYNNKGEVFTLSGNGAVDFSRNSVSSSTSSSHKSYGGAIYNKGSLTLSENGEVCFSGNKASAESDYYELSYNYGGAIYNTGTVTLRNNGAVLFLENSAFCLSRDYGSYSYGGAIYNTGTFTLSENEEVTFSGNSASSGKYTYGDGGAIYNTGSFSVTDNGNVSFIGNRTPSFDSSTGGAIYNSYRFTLSGNKDVVFSGNMGTSSYPSFGGAIYNGGTFLLLDNADVTFIDNKSSYSGGAVYNSSTYTLSGNGDVTFIGNRVSSPSASDRPDIFSGGAISNSATFTLNGNGNVRFVDNKITSSYDTSSSRGGAIYNGGRFILSDNGDVTFSGNTASVSTYGSKTYGGAIYNSGTFSLSGNGNVLFEKNAEVCRGTYRLRSIYSTNSLNLSSSAGTAILFKDSVYASGTVNLNQVGTGDIIFTGENTEADLREVKGGEDGTADEIANSRSSVLDAAVTLGGGTLQVRDGASLTVKNLTAAGGTELLLHEAQFTVTGDSSLAAVCISGKTDIAVQEGATLTLQQTMTNNGMLTLSGTIIADGFSTQTTDYTGYIDAAGEIGRSGFIRTGLVYQLTLTEGTGTLNADAANVRYHDVAMVLGSNGVATGIGVSGIDYSTYYIHDDSASLSSILEKSPSVKVLMTGGVLDLAHLNGSYANRIEGSGAVLMNGIGTVTLTGQNTYSGGTRLESGTLVVGNTQALGTGAVELAGGELNLNNLNGTFGNALTGTGGLTIDNGSNTLTLSGNSSFLGGITLQGGKLAAGHDAAFGRGAVTLAGGTLDLNRMAANNTLAVTGTATLNNANRYTGQLVLDGGSLSGTALQLVKDATLYSGSIANNMTGRGGVIKEGTGTVTLSGLNNYKGETVINSGTLKVAGMLTSNIQINEQGTLDTGKGMTLTINQRLTMAGGNIVGDFSTGADSDLVVQQGSSVSGSLTFGGGCVTLNNVGADNTLSVSGTLNLAEKTQLKLIGYDTAGAYYLATYGSLQGSVSNVDLSMTFPEGSRQKAGIAAASGYLVLTITGDATVLNWRGGSGVWETLGSAQWSADSWVDDKRFHACDTVVFDRGGSLSINGTVQPKEVQVSGSAAVTFSGSGSIVGEGSLLKEGSCTLTLNAVNSYTGGSTLRGGSVKATGAQSFGTNRIRLQGGTLNLNGQAVRNAVTATGGSISGGSAYAGELTVDGNVSISGSLTAGAVNLLSGTLTGGTLTDTIVYATEGGIGSAFGGDSELVGNNYVLQSAVSNTGTLRLSGILDASALEIASQESGCVSLDGVPARSGFVMRESYGVRLVNGGTVEDCGAIILYNGTELTLNSNGTATSGGTVDYATYVLTGTDTATTAAIHAVSSTATITQTGGTLTVNDTATVNATGGKLTLSGGTLNGTLSGTTITATSGTIAAALSGNNTLNGSSYALKNVLTNSGTLTIGGALDVSALTLKTTAATHIDVNGNNGASGFAKAAGYSVQLVDGGTTVNNKATIKHGTRTLTLGSNGTATSGGTIDYSTYLLTGTATASTSAIHGKSSNAVVSMTGGTLTVNDTATVNASAGKITLSGGTLNGTLSGTTITATSGTIAAALSGNNTLTGSNYAMQRVIANSGTLTIGGTLDVSALTLNTTAATHIDVNGNSGASGFAKTVGYSVQLVNGGTTVNNKATIKHGTRTLTLNSDGAATSGGTIDYSTYLLTGTATASTSAIHGVSADAVISQTGGTLTVNDTATVNATAGKITLSGGVLNGSLSGTTITATSGTLAATLTGNNTLNGNNYAVQQMLTNSGTLTIGGTLDVSKLTLKTTAATHLDVNGTSGTSGFAKAAGYSVQLVNDGTTVNNNATIKHGTRALTLNSNGTATSGGSIDYSTYLLTGTATATTSAIHGKSSNAVVSMTGGTLTVNDTATVNATAGKLTLSGGTLNGTLSGTTITATSGTIAAALSGNNTLTGSNYAVQRVIANSGTLTIGGTLDVSALTLNTTAATHIDVNGVSGASGFAKVGSASVQMVNGGTVVNNGATVKHGTLELMLNSNGTATTGGIIDYGTYLLTGTSTASTSAIHGVSADAVITQTGGTLTVNDTATVNATAGKLTLSGGTLNGTLSGTTITATNGTIAASLCGNNTLTGSSYALKNVLTNSGTLTIGGTLDVSALTLNSTAATHIDVNGNSGASGFAKEAGYSVQLVNGGATVNNNATVKHGTRTLTLNSDGTATSGGTIDYSTYLLTGTSTATTSAIHGKSSNAVVSMTGGTLTVNDTATVNATAGNITLSGGTLNGTLSGTTITATGGTLAATLSGSNTLIGSNYAVQRVIANSGTLTIGGTLDVSKLTLNTTDATHIDVNGKSGASGFAKVGSASVLVVNGGTVVNNGATVKHGTLELILNRNGTATTGGTIDYGTYLLTGTSTATTSAIHGKSSTAAITQTGGTLTVNDTATVNATAGNITLSGGTLNGTLTDTAILANSGTLAAAVSGKGSLTVDGKVTLTGKVSTAVMLNSGCLTADSGMELADGQTLTFNGGSMAGDILTTSGSTLALKSDASLAGALTLNGGIVALNGNALTITGELSLQSATQLDVSAYKELGQYTLLQADSFAGNFDKLILSGASSLYAYALSQDANCINLLVSQLSENHTWTDTKGTLTGETFEPGDSLTITGAAAITIKGEVEQGGVTVSTDKNVKLTTDKKTVGSGIAGDGSLTKNGAGVLTMNAGNSYTGGTVLNAGTLKATAADSFGTGDITVNGGTLDLGSKAVSNDIVLSGEATLKGDAKYTGAVIVEGDAMLLAKTSYKGMTTIGADSLLTLAPKATMAGSITIDGGELDITAPKGMTLAKDAWMLFSSGTVKGMLTIGAKSELVWLDGTFETSAPVLKGGTVDLGGWNALTLTGSKAQVQFGDKVIDLPGKGTVRTDEALTVNSGTVTVNSMGGYEGELAVNSGTLKLSTGKVTTENNIVVKGTAAVVNGGTHYGNITVDGVLAKGTNIKLLDENQKVALNGEGTMLGTISGKGIIDVSASIDATAAKLTAATINLNSGTFTNTKGIKLAKGQTLTLAGASLDLGPKGALATVAGSTLVVDSNTTLTGSLTLGGGELVFENGDLNVSGTLTLSKAMTVTGSGTIHYSTLKAPKKLDVVKLFGEGAELDEESCTLTFNNGDALRMAAAPLDAAPALFAMTPATNPVADAMVQADWGILDAERAFMGAVNNRSQHATLLDKGRGAAWVSAFGASVRHGNQGTHHGSDGNIEGAAFGLEHAVSDTGTLGLAVGRSKNRLAATGVTHLRQETAHVALYGQKQLKHGFTADAAATYGDTETKLGAASWQQKSAALTARLTHAKMLSDTTAFRTFGGLSYEATDAGSIGTAHTGSVQNLRGELGAGITHTSGKAHLYAEAALTGDMVRHNPTVDFGGARTHGANPGRLGLRASVGGIYEFTDTWSGTVSYGIEAESRSTAHTLNIGVSKSF